MAIIKDNDRSIKKIDKRIDLLNSKMNNLYSSTYKTRTDNRDSMDSIMNTIDNNVNDILNKVHNQNISDLSQLYIRLQGKESRATSDVQKGIEELLDENGNILESINFDNVRKSIQAEDYQIDLICKYMTKLEDALDIKKDNILSSDNFTKEFYTVTTTGNNDKKGLFNDKQKLLKKKYELPDLFDEMVYDAEKYGEYFLYQVPYQKALSKLIERKNRLHLGIKYESANIGNSELLIESSNMEDELKNKLDSKYIDTLKEGEMRVNIVFDDNGIIPEPIEYVKESSRILNEQVSLTESYRIEKDLEKGVLVKENELNGLRFDSLGTDGLISNKKDEKISDKIKGTVLYKIPRSEIFPVYIGEMNIGYLNIKVSNDYIDTVVLNGGTYNSLTNNTKLLTDDLDRQNDNMISYIAGTLSEKIDAKFINANIDLKEEIYAILRYNDNFCCTKGTNNICIRFIPVEDVNHFYFKLNKKTHRGISDLEKAIVPGMIWCLLYLTTTIGYVSRAQDKRIYYVKQNVEQNVAKTLLNVINQIKKGNMGMRQLENMNSIFNIVGRYNDHIIPMSQSGDAPIQMEVMSGQNIDTPTDLMDKMEDAAVSSTDVPLEFVQSVNQVDYAARFTMSNSKFLRKIYKRQGICQRMFTTIYIKLYNNEFNENDNNINIFLPAPAYLAMTNMKQLVDNIKDYVMSIADIVCADQDDDIKNEFIKIQCMRLLGTYIDFDQLNEDIEQATMNIKSKKVAVPSGDGSSEDSDFDSEDDYGNY